MALHDTTAKEEADKALAEAQKGVRALRGYLIEMDKKITQHRENNRGLEFNPEWGAMLVKNSLYIFTETLPVATARRWFEQSNRWKNPVKQWLPASEALMNDATSATYLFHVAVLPAITDICQVIGTRLNIHAH